MKLTKQRQKETGAFYTPKRWADLAVEYIYAALKDWFRDDNIRLQEFFFWDMAAGEGFLLDALPSDCERFGSTLEREDWGIMRQKDYGCAVFDFLDGDLSRLLDIERVSKRRLIVFTNPPYMKLPASNNSFAKRKYKMNDATGLFYYRIFQEIKPVFLCSFSKMDIWQGQQMEKFIADNEIFERTHSGFMTHSKTWGLAGSFAIAFAIFTCQDYANNYHQIAEQDYRLSFVFDVADDAYPLGATHRVLNNGY